MRSVRQPGGLASCMTRWARSMQEGKVKESAQPLRWICGPGERNPNCEAIKSGQKKSLTSYQIDEDLICIATVRE